MTGGQCAPNFSGRFRLAFHSSASRTALNSARAAGGKSSRRGDRLVGPRPFAHERGRAPGPHPRNAPVRGAVGAMKSKAKPKPGGKAPQMAFRGYWDATEEQALRDAVQKHGIGAWEKMRHDVDFKVLKCVPSRARARNSSATARAPRVSLRPFTPPTREERARTRITRDSRVSGAGRPTRGRSFSRRHVFCRRMRARGGARARRGARREALERAHRETTSSTPRSPASHPRPVPSQGPHGRPAEGQMAQSDKVPAPASR